MKRTGTLPMFLLRAAIGWHFLFEGLVKLFTPGWSAAGYLAGSQGFLSGLFRAMAANETLLQVIDIANVWGLILIGAGLLLGVFIRLSAIAGILLLLLYYFAYPPFGPSAGLSAEGHYWIINRNLLEAMMLVLVAVIPAYTWSLERFFRRKKEEEAAAEETLPGTEQSRVKRRELLKGLVTLPFFGGVIYAAAARENDTGIDALSSATIALKKYDLGELKGTMPKGKVGNLEISRLVMGCNQIGGWAHARDLGYVDQMFRQYNTEKKVFETFSIAEQAGINTTNMVTNFYPLLNKYLKITGSSMISICQAKVESKQPDPLDEIKQSVDYGATSIYIQGGTGDVLVRDGEFDLVANALDYIRSQGMLAGMGAHSVLVPVELEKRGIRPDYYFKTIHHDRYWSAHPREFREEFSVDNERFLDHNKFHDNLFDMFPEQTVEVFAGMDIPLFGFKVLAAGAIKPEDGFRYAFKNGADFICVGMFDWQVVDNVNTAIEVLGSDLKRTRPWYG